VLAFLRHLAEMAVAMTAGMVLLDQVWRVAFSALGAVTFGARPDVSAVVMATSMTIGMTVWMVHREHSAAAVAEMGAAMYVPYLVPLVPYWAGVVPGDAAVAAGHVLMMPAVVLAMLHRRGDYTHFHPSAAPVPQTPPRRVGDALKHRWPTWLALLLTFDSWIHPGVPPVWLLVGLGAEYLVIGTLRRQLLDRRLLALHVAGFLGYCALAGLAVSVDADAARYLIAAGLFLHTGWDIVLHRADKVVWRWYAEACAVIDLVVGLSVLLLLP
jgi:hypothetical protein